MKASKRPDVGVKYELGARGPGDRKPKPLAKWRDYAAEAFAVKAARRQTATAIVMATHLSERIYGPGQEFVCATAGVDFSKCSVKDLCRYMDLKDELHGALERSKRAEAALEGSDDDD